MRILLPAIVVISALVLACSDGGDDASPTVDPTRTAPSPTVVPLELAEPIDAVGSLVHVYNGAIYVGALDGSSQVRLRLPGMAPEKAGYAGTAMIDGVRWLYFAAQLSHTANGTDFPVGEYALARVRIGERDAEEVARFTSRSGAGSGAGAASISPDGARLLYRSLDGIVLRDLATGVEEVLFDGTCAEEPNTKCEAFSWPQWSPAGDAMITRHHRYEITTAAYARPVAATGVVELAEYGGEAQTWAADGATFCTYSTVFVPAGLWLVDASTLAADDLAQAFPTNTQLERCFPATDEAVAIQFKPAGDSGFASQVAIVDPNASDAPGTMLTLPEFWRVEGWLPDGSGFMVSKSNNCTPCNADEPLIAALTVDGVMHELPFEVATARTSERDAPLVLAVVGP